MEPFAELANPLLAFPFTPQHWEQTPLAVQAYIHTLHDKMAQLLDRVETLEARLTQNSTTSSRPLSSDAPFKKPRRLTRPSTPRKAGGKPGHPGHCQVLLPPTMVSTNVLGAPDSHGPELGGASAGGAGRLWDLGARRAATALPYGHPSPHRWGGARLVRSAV
jgi:hypothetical protein